MARISYKWRVYLHGMFAAVLGSTSNTITMALVDPNDFNPFIGADWNKIGALVIVSVLVGFFTYTKLHPLPDPEKDTDFDQVAIEMQDRAKAIIAGTGTGDGTRV